MRLLRTGRSVRSRTTALLATAVLALPVLTATPAAATAPTPPGSSGNVILNMFQWTWDSVAAECATIGDAGFGYVQVSPPQEHIQGSNWWTSYQPVSYRIESKLGTRAEFANMVTSCDDAGAGVIADAVINHTTGADVGSGTGVAGSSFGLDSFPGIYGAADFNDCRSNISNYQDRYQVQNCRLVSLQDLRTGSPYVQGVIADYLNDLISLGVSGFRIDAAKHIPAADLAAIKAQLTDPDIYWVQEVIGASGEPITESEYVGTGDVHEFDYARTLKSRFDGNIAQLNTISNGLLPSAQAGVFVDNHDTERNGETMNQSWGAKYILANTFMLSYPYGSPSVYSGYRYTDKDAGAPGATATTVPDATCTGATWTCTQRWTEIAGMVGFHNEVEGTAVTNWWDNGNNHIAYGRGDRGYVTINNTASAVTRTYQTSLPAGTYCDVIASDDCTVSYTVSSAGTFTATVPAYGALALHVGETTTDGGTPASQASFAVNASTVWGQSIYVVGNIPALGNWTPSAGLALSSASYPVWTGNLSLPAGTSFQYKYVKLDGSGNVTWESGANRTATVNGTITLNDTWRP